MKNEKILFFGQMPAEEYHRDSRDGKFLSSHLLSDFRKTPLLYKKKMSGEVDVPESSSFMIGRALHSFTLEGRPAFDSEFLVSDGPINPKTGEPFGKLTKAYREWSASIGKTVISWSDFSMISKLSQSVWTHPIARDLVKHGTAELTVRSLYCNEPCQIRMDKFLVDYEGSPVICDLKTCENIDWFESDSKKFSYPHQMAFYREVLRTASEGKIVADCYLIGVEKREPYRCGVWKLTDELLQSAKTENERAITELQACRLSGEWPTRLEDLRILDL